MKTTLGWTRASLDPLWSSSLSLLRQNLLDYVGVADGTRRDYALTATPSSTKTDAGASATLAKQVEKMLKYQIDRYGTVDYNGTEETISLTLTKSQWSRIQAALASSRSTDSGAMIERLAAKVAPKPQKYNYECPNCHRLVSMHEKCVCGQYVGGEDYAARFMEGYDSIRSTWP